jgi:dynein heavy chain
MAVSYTWGIGGSVNEEGKDKFDTIVRDQFKAAPFPPAYSVFDYYFNMKGDKQFKLWSNRRREFEYDKEMPYFEMVVPTDDTTKYSAFMEQLFSTERNLFFTGLTGVGKSVIVQSTIDRLKEKDLTEIIINFSA